MDRHQRIRLVSLHVMLDGTPKFDKHRKGTNKLAGSVITMGFQSDMREKRPVWRSLAGSENEPMKYTRVHLHGQPVCVQRWWRWKPACFLVRGAGGMIVPSQFRRAGTQRVPSVASLGAPFNR